MFADFISQLGATKNGEIPFYFRNQFKIRENFINPNSKYFDGIVQKLISEDKQGIKRKWDKQCKMMFIWVLGKFFQQKNKKSVNPNQREWAELATILKTEESILKQRWITLINPFSKSINWDQEEDEIIRSLMNEQEGKHIWTQIALELYNRNNGQYIRTPKQVRERWMNYLNPNLNKSLWNPQEDDQLLQMVVKHGKRWSLISSLLQGRTENQVKNRFKSLIQKIYKDEEQDDLEEVQAVKDYLKRQDPASDNVKNDKDAQQKIEKCEKEFIQEYDKKNKKKKRKINPTHKKLSPKKSAINSPHLKEENISQNQHQMDLIEKKESVSDLQHKQVEQFQQEQLAQQLLHQHHSQNCNENNQQTPNTLSYYLPSQLQQFDYKQQQQYMYQAYRPFFDEFSQQQQLQQMQLTPQQILMEQYLKSCQSNYSLMSPFPFINSTPMTYTPVQQMYTFNNQFIGRSPQMVCSPFIENQSPSIPNQYWQYHQQQMDQFQNEQQKQTEFNNKLEFLNSSNLLDDWKRKRDNQKQNLIFQPLNQSDQ